MMKSLEFYFDYLSPYAYFAWNKIEKFAADHHVELIIKPVVFGKLLDHWGQLGPAEIPPKRAWLTKYCMYYATTNNLPLKFPKSHPFNSLSALRASLKIVSGEHQAKLISEIFLAGWGESQDIGDIEVIANVATKIGLDGDEIKESINNIEVKEALKNNTADAISKGVFGIPTMIFEGELFWGNDQFEYLSNLIKGNYQVNMEQLQELATRPRGIDRDRVKKY